MSGGVNAFIYRRTFSVRREGPESGVGAPTDEDDYGGTNEAGEQTLATGIPCSLQHASTGSSSEANLPGGAPSRGRWRFHVPKGALASGLVKRGYILVDDQGTRYIVLAPYEHALGWRIECDVAEV
jgi:hypothetical protein